MTKITAHFLTEFSPSFLSQSVHIVYQMNHQTLHNFNITLDMLY